MPCRDYENRPKLCRAFTCGVDCERCDSCEGNVVLRIPGSIDAEDTRYFELHGLGVTRIDRFMSMSNMKHDALTQSGIEIGERVAIPDELIPPDASVEMEAKKAAGYYAPDGAPSAEDLKNTSGRALEKY